ncbi:MAG: NRDE family protein [Bryobacteraceae bacterium]
MCTVTWLHEPGGYHLLCNRDEKLARDPAHPPAEFVRHGVRVVAPVDPASGGSWIAVNEFGVATVLVNGDGSPPPGQCSRGLLTLELATAGSVLDAARRASHIYWNGYAPCTVAMLEAGRPAFVIVWDGVQPRLLTDGDSCLPLTSSSFAPDRARECRTREFARRAGGPDGLFRFHQSHARARGGERRALSPCMHRDASATVSFSWIHVDANDIRFFYAPGSACAWEPGVTYSLLRAA